MTELAKWTMVLRDWRKRNGYTTPEWESYVTALNIQQNFFDVAFFVAGLLMGGYVAHLF